MERKVDKIFIFIFPSNFYCPFFEIYFYTFYEINYLKNKLTKNYLALLS